MGCQTATGKLTPLGNLPKDGGGNQMSKKFHVRGCFPGFNSPSYLRANERNMYWCLLCGSMLTLNVGELEIFALPQYLTLLILGIFLIPSPPM
jgi:hypothetical protein